MTIMIMLINDDEFGFDYGDHDDYDKDDGDDILHTIITATP